MTLEWSYIGDLASWQDKRVGIQIFVSSRFASTFAEPKVFLWVVLGSTRFRSIAAAATCPALPLVAGAYSGSETLALSCRYCNASMNNQLAMRIQKALILLD